LCFSSSFVDRARQKRQLGSVGNPTELGEQHVARKTTLGRHQGESLYPKLELCCQGVTAETTCSSVSFSPVKEDVAPAR